MALVVTDVADADGSHLPQISVTCLSYGHIKLMADSSYDRFYHLSLAFKGSISRQAESDS